MLKAGVALVSDVVTKKKNIKQSARARGTQFVKEVLNKPQPKRKRQSATRPRKGNTKRSRTDIFV